MSYFMPPITYEESPHTWDEILDDVEGAEAIDYYVPWEEDDDVEN